MHYNNNNSNHITKDLTSNTTPVKFINPKPKSNKKL